MPTVLESVTERVRLVEADGVRVLHFDYAGHREPAAIVAEQGRVRAWVARQPEASLLTLVNVTGIHFDRVGVRALQETATHNRPYVRRGTIVGVSGLLRVIYATLVRATGRDLRLFETEAEALAYLRAGVADAH